MSLTRSAAIEGRPKGIRVNAVLPGAIETPMLRENPKVKSGVEKLDPAESASPRTSPRRSPSSRRTTRRSSPAPTLRVDGGRLATL